ncbi:MAG: hypothetical protein LAE24_07700 [Candidatus Contendobacter sp.]|nr:hypothetical protein [Candidatus Contendobacter sp.]
MAAESLVFPALPAQAFQGAPIYLEPMMGSGECLTVLVAVAGAAGMRVIPAIRPVAIRAMYGVKSGHFNGLVSLLQESLHDHLEKWRSFDGWRSPLVGARVGDVRPLLADDVDHALRQLILLHASLSAVDDADDDQETSTEEPLDAHWWKDIKSAVVARRPALATGFHVQIDGQIEGYRFRLGFFAHGLVAHFGLARPDRLSSDSRDLKAKLWELQTVQTGRLDIREASLVLCAPMPSPLYGVRQLASARALISEIQQEAVDRHLSLHSVTTTEEAAEFLIQRVAA